MLSRFLNVLLPPSCAGCGTSNDWWCESCQANVVLVGNATCPKCKTLTGTGRFCSRCRPNVELAGIVSGAYWSEPLHRAIKQFKYRQAAVLGRELAEYQVIALSRIPRLNGMVLVPIPLHPSRQDKRGVNQAEQLATEIGRLTGLPGSKALYRVKPTLSQTGLNRIKRSENVTGAFRWRGPPSTRIVLVDDICTTGATLNAAALACRAAGAREVWGLVITQR